MSRYNIKRYSAENGAIRERTESYRNPATHSVLMELQACHEQAMEALAIQALEVYPHKTAAIGPLGRDIEQLVRDVVFADAYMGDLARGLLEAQLANVGYNDIARYFLNQFAEQLA